MTDEHNEGGAQRSLADCARRVMALQHTTRLIAESGKAPSGQFLHELADILTDLPKDLVRLAGLRIELPRRPDK